MAAKPKETKAAVTRVTVTRVMMTMVTAAMLQEVTQRLNCDKSTIITSNLKT